MSDVCWAKSIDGGRTWTHGSLPGIPTVERSGPYERVSDPAVPFDAAYNVWLNGRAADRANVSHSSGYCQPIIQTRSFMSTSTDGGVTCLQRRLQIQRAG